MTPALDAPVASCSAAAAQVRCWLNVVSHTDPRYGGLSAAVPRGAREVAANGQFAVALAAFCAPGEEVPPAGLAPGDLSFWPVARGAWLRSGRLRRSFAEQVRAADGVHIHGLWEASTAVGARTALRADKPYMVSAHGMLEPWALASKPLKKKIYASLMERGIVARAACLHALTRAEAAQYRDFGAGNPIVIIPNAVDIPEAASPELFFSSFPQMRSRRLLLFLGRLHPKKGLDLLVEAWAKLWRNHRDWHLVLAGPDADNTQSKLRALIRAHGMETTITFTGMLAGEAKWSALAAAEAFVLPSYSEGLSMAVLEAMGAGLPVVVTENCNLPEVAEHRAGWQIPAEVDPLTAALNELMGQTPAVNQDLGARGSYLVTTRYNPRVVAEQMTAAYNFVLDGIQPTNAELLLR